MPTQNALVKWPVLPRRSTFPPRNVGEPQCWPVGPARAEGGLWADQTSTGLRAAKSGLGLGVLAVAPETMI